VRGKSRESVPVVIVIGIVIVVVVVIGVEHARAGCAKNKSD
jgi:hypothetical protein